MKLILASGSSARRSMLCAAGYEFEVIPSRLDEEPIKQRAQETALELSALASQLAVAKAAGVSADHPGRCVIGSDQVLGCDGVRFSKVTTMEAAARQLRKLQGKTHQLHCAVAVCRDGETLFEHVETADLAMWPMTDDDIDHYLSDAGPAVLGSVGCYQIEGTGIRLFSKISGSHFTIMGMPLLPLLGFLRSHCSQKDD